MDASVERVVAHGSTTVLFYNRKSSRYVQKNEFQAASKVRFFFLRWGTYDEKPGRALVHVVVDLGRLY